MRPEEVKALLTEVRAGSKSPEEAFAALRHLPVDDLGFARVDSHRELRQGLAEAIYAEGKSSEQVVAIARSLLALGTSPIIATRVPEETAAALLQEFPNAAHHPIARVVTLNDRIGRDTVTGSITIVTAGTSDLPVAEEGAVVAEAYGASVFRANDVGVAGLHRLLEFQPQLHTSDVVIVVAGMDGALASLVGGLASVPVVAVPTSVGYGASFEGLSALLAMLNSCAAGVAVTNIDNGFGAATFALRVLLSKRTP